MESLFSRRASVGLMVLAPNPEARPEMADCRLFPADEGVWARCGWPFWTGRDGELLGSGSGRGGAWRLFTLFARDCVVAVSARGRSAPPEVVACIVVRRLLLVILLLRVGFAFRFESVAEGGNGPLAFLPSNMEEMIPGPKDFRGGRDSEPADCAAVPEEGGP